MDTIGVNDKVTIKKNKKTAVVAWIDESKDHENYLLEIEGSEEIPKFYNRDDFEIHKKDELVGLDQILKDKQEDIAIKQLKKKLKSSGFVKEEIKIIIDHIKVNNNYLLSIRELLQYLKDKNNAKNKEEIIKEVYNIINK